MALTSLAAQLKRLEAPQTSLLKHSNKKASFLFEPQEAANYDRDTFYELGLSGLEELKKLNPQFASYEATLFDVSSKAMERSVQTSEVNSMLDRHLRQFLALLSPYFLVKPAHKALEWLINRYHIHNFNVDDLLMLALPYHETMKFARLLQLMPLTEHSRWHWLAPVKKEGVPLSKGALLNRAASDLSFLRFVCEMPKIAIEAHGNSASSLCTLFSFYCTTVVGALERSKAVTEAQVSHMLPSIMLALGSSLVDFTSAAYIILARLATKTSLGDKLLAALYNKISKVNLVKLRYETTLTLIVLNQNDKKKCLPLKALKQLSCRSWLVSSLEYWTSKGILTASFICSLLGALFRAVQEGEPSLKPFASDLLSIPLDDSDSVLVFRCLLKEYRGEEKKELEWFKEQLELLEVRYPTGFDCVSSEALKKPQSSEAMALEAVLGACSKRKLFQQLVHPSTDIRRHTLQQIQALSLNTAQVPWLEDAVLERLSDDKQVVVKAALECSTVLASVDPDRLVPLLTATLYRLWSKGSSAVVELVQGLVCYSLPSHYHTLSIAFLPLLVIDTSLMKQLKHSPIVTDTHLKTIFTDVERGDSLKDALWSSIEAGSWSTGELSASLSELSRVHKVFQFLSLILQAGTPRPSLLDDYLHSDELNLEEICELKDGESLFQCVSICRSGKLPLEGALYSLARVSLDEQSSDWLDISLEQYQPFLRTYTALAQRAADKKQKHSHFYKSAVDTFLKKNFGEAEARLYFLLSCGVYSEVAVAKYSLRSALGLLSAEEELRKEAIQERSGVVPLVVCLLHRKENKLRKLTLGLVGLLSNCMSLSHYHFFLSILLSNSLEISLDSEQIVMLAYTQLSQAKEIRSLVPSELKVHMKSTLGSLLSVLKQQRTPLFVKADLLRILQFVTPIEFMSELKPILNEFIGSKRKLDKVESSVVGSVLRRFDQSQVHCFKEDQVWTWLEEVLSDSATEMLDEEDSPSNPAAFLLQQITQDFLDKLPKPRNEIEERLLTLIITKTYECENICVIKSVTSLFKRITVGGEILSSMLDWLKRASAPCPTKTKGKIRRSNSNLLRLETLETADWKKGVFLLELVQSKKKFTDSVHLLPVLFDILNKCLQFETQGPVEYCKQLVLSVVVQCCGSLEQVEVTGETLQVEHIVHCIRASHNPQTHHHALLALTVVAQLFPSQVLHNIMDIFTFVGSSMLRQDDIYSFQVICKLVETIVPILVKGGEGGVVGVMRVFVSALLDIPEHRRLTLLHKLLTTLGETDFLWVFIALVLESQVILVQHFTAVSGGKGNSEEAETRGKTEVTVELCAQFPPKILLHTVFKLLEYSTLLPSDKEKKVEVSYFPLELLAIFDVKKNTGKQLRHFKYKILTFLSSLLSSTFFVRQVAELSEEENSKLEGEFTQLMECCLSYMKIVSKQVEENCEQPTSKYWKIMLTQCYELLDKTSGLVPSETFVRVVGELLSAEDETVRRKAMELIGWRLGQGKPLSAGCLLPLVDRVRSACVGPAASRSALTQQTALFSLKLLTRHLALTNTDLFVQILGEVTDALNQKGHSWEVVGSLLLCLGELVSTLKAHSIPFLNQFISPLFELLYQHKLAGELVLLSGLTCLQKVVETLCNFLGPYLGKILHQVCVLTATCEVSQDDIHRAQPILAKLKAIRNKVSHSVNLGVLVPAVTWCYYKLVKQSELAAVASAMATLSDAFSVDARLTPDLSAFFLQALSFRSNTVDQPECVRLVEPHVLSTLTSLVLKLSESSFRPFYHKIFDWAFRSQVTNFKHRAITFYKLSSEIANRLRGLFVLFAGLFIQNAARLLDSNNVTKQKSEAWFEGDTGDEMSCVLIESILSTLLAVFTYDSHDFLSKERFDLIMQPLVDQLENLVGGEDKYEERCKELVSPCLAQMAASTSDDSIWKQLNYQVLLKTRHHLPQVRLASVETVCTIARKLGEDFLPLLPETVPFLAELLEDSDENIEKQTNRIISHLETILGEPLQKYF